MHKQNDSIEQVLDNLTEPPDTTHQHLNLGLWIHLIELLHRPIFHFGDHRQFDRGSVHLQAQGLEIFSWHCHREASKVWRWRQLLDNDGVLDDCGGLRILRHHIRQRDDFGRRFGLLGSAAQKHSSVNRVLRESLARMIGKP